MKKNKRKITINDLIIYLVFLSFIVSTSYVFVKMLLAPTNNTGAEHLKVKGDYILELLLCFAGILVIMLPSILKKRWKIEMPSHMMLLYVVFLYGAIFLGEVHSFYFTVNHWDTTLHAFSGVVIALFGFSIVEVLNRNKENSLSPLLICLFAFSFAVTLGVLWEIWEFIFDLMLDSNLQRYADATDGSLFVGRAAVLDTMKDLVVDFIGAASISIIGYIYLKKDPEWIKKFSFKKGTSVKKSNKESEEKKELIDELE